MITCENFRTGFICFCHNEVGRQPFFQFNFLQRITKLLWHTFRNVFSVPPENDG